MPDENTTGHEAELDTMDRQAFQAALQAKMDAGDTAGKDEAHDESTAAGDTERKEEATPKQEAETKPEPKPFKLAREEQPQAKPEGDTGQDDEGGELVPIIHRGQEIRVTQKRLKELAQKGFDYDHKVGPHGRIVQLIEGDREAATILDNYLRAKMEGKPFRYGEPAPAPAAPNPFEAAAKNRTAPKPTLRPLREFDSEEAWLEANLPAIAERLKPQEAPRPKETPRAEAQAPTTQNITQDPVILRLMARDPDNFQKVAGVIKQTADQYLTPAQIREIETNPDELVRFYDWTKENVLRLPVTKQNVPHETPAPKIQTTPPAKPSFKAKSGGGALDRSVTTEAQKVWDMPSKDFRAYMDKIKNGETA